MKYCNPTIKKKKYLLCFTLIELLVVMGILGVLMAVTILVINPAEYLQKARDTNRISDLNTLKTALTLYSVDTGTDFSTPDNIVYVSLPDTSSTCATWGLPALPSPWVYKCVTTTNYRKIDGTGWVPINLSAMASRPLTSLPVDPTNNSTYYYTFVKGGSFELNAITESQSYKSGPSTKQNLPGVITVGTNLNLSPIYNTTGLVGYWNFDEMSGTTSVDSSGKGNTGTLVNGPTRMTGKNCKMGGCLSFDGVDDFVSIPDSTSLHLAFPFSVSFWVKPIENKKWMPLYKGSTTSDNSWYIYADTTSDLFANFWYGSNSYGADANSNYLNTWSHIVAIYRGSGLPTLIYLNGSLKGTSSNLPTGISYNTQPLLIGQYSGTAYNLHGFIDCVRIYNRALSAAEVRALYNATK